MPAFRSCTSTRIRSVLVLAAALLVIAGCGSGDGGGDSGGSDGAGTRSGSDTPKAGSKGAVEGKSRIDVFAETPQIKACMEDAGFVRDAPTTGGVAAWRHDDGSRVVIGSEEGVTTGIAAEIGTAERPARIDGVRVIAASPTLERAAAACLDA
ncbi:MAG: hypothetical protein JWM86_27 [Thermoleophilia bacterium]|nr:hypothetical protein [Thermoleophilia bacterium]